jgi:hypothetical protein
MAIYGELVELTAADTSAPLIQVRTPGIFYTHFYNHIRRLCLEKILYLQ